MWCLSIWFIICWPPQRCAAHSDDALLRLQLLHLQSSTVAGDRFTGATFSACTDANSCSGPKVRSRHPQVHPWNLLCCHHQKRMFYSYLRPVFPGKWLPVLSCSCQRGFCWLCMWNTDSLVLTDPMLVLETGRFGSVVLDWSAYHDLIKAYTLASEMIWMALKVEWLLFFTCAALIWSKGE